MPGLCSLLHLQPVPLCFWTWRARAVTVWVCWVCGCFPRRPLHQTCFWPQWAGGSAHLPGLGQTALHVVELLATRGLGSRAVSGSIGVWFVLRSGWALGLAFFHPLWVESQQVQRVTSVYSCAQIFGLCLVPSISETLCCICSLECSALMLQRAGKPGSVCRILSLSSLKPAGALFSSLFPLKRRPSSPHPDTMEYMGFPRCWEGVRIWGVGRRGIPYDWGSV